MKKKKADKGIYRCDKCGARKTAYYGSMCLAQFCWVQCNGKMIDIK